jgi:Helix-turn-helix domain
MEARGTRSVAIDPRTSLAMWLRAGRAERKLTLDDVARVTKIQPRILEKIEAGNLEGLPAAVFVRGFVKSFARCVGLDEGEAVQRYGECANAPVGPTSSVARAFVETLVAAPKSESKAAPVAPKLLAPPEIFPEASMEMKALPIADDEFEISIESAPELELIIPAAIEVVETPVIEVIEVAAAVEEPKKPKRSRKKAAGTGAPRTRKKKSGQPDLAVGSVESTDVEAVAIETAIVAAAAKSAMETGPHVAIDTATIDASAQVDAATIAAAPNDSTVAPRSIFDAPTDEELAASAKIVDEPGLPRRGSAAEWQRGVVDEPGLPRRGSAAEWQRGVVDTESAADDLFAPADGIVIDHDDELAHGSEPVVADPWQPTMPPIAASAPWKRPAFKTSTYSVPSLVIDDSDPDMAERERDDRETATKPGPHRVSFLPPILLDREDKSSRQGGLTLAVILLLIAATLTLSYLMRRPSVSGDGVTQAQPISADTTIVA